VQNFLTFWVDETSVDIQITPAATTVTESATTVVGGETTISGIETSITEGTTIAATTTQAPIIGGIDIYEGCDVTKTCFGIGSADCVSQRNCRLVGAVIYDNRDDTFQFEVRSAPGAAYASIALSRDSTPMNEDSVIDCVNNNGVIEAHASWTHASGAIRTGIVSCTTIHEFVA